MKKVVTIVTMMPYYKNVTIEGNTEAEIDLKEDILMCDVFNGDLVIEDDEWIPGKNFKHCNKALYAIYEQSFATR